MKRKVNRVGTSTLTVSLPSKWAKEYGIKQGDEVELTELPDGPLLLATSALKKEKKEITISIDDFEYFTLSRYLSVLYRIGYDRITFIHKKKMIYHDKRKKDVSIDKAMKDLVSRNVGSEIVSQTSERTEIECFIVDEGKNIETIERRIYYLFKQMEESILEMAEKKHTGIAEEAYLHHDNVAKFINYYLRELESSDKPLAEKQFSYGLYMFIDKLVDKLRHLADKIALYGLTQGVKVYLQKVFSLMDDQFNSLHKGDYDRRLVEKRYELLHEYQEMGFSKKELPVVMEINLFLDTITYFTELIIVKKLEGRR